MHAEDKQRWKLTIAYDGQPYEGWQSQPSGNTVQDHLERALIQMNGMPPGIRVHGSGRTDAGVHAEGQVAHLDAPSSLSLTEASWPPALNARLPPSIRVLKSEAVSTSFHARFSVVEKTYVYKVFLGNILPPMLAGRYAQVPGFLDLQALSRAARLLEGRHDFRSFAAERGSRSHPPRSTVRTLREISITHPAGNEVYMRFTADGFLYRMVRMLVGTMIKFAQGRLSEDELKKLIEGPPGLKTSACAPAAGLYLTEVRYGKEFQSA